MGSYYLGVCWGAPLWSEGWGVPEGTSVSCASAKVQSFLHIIPRPLSNPLCIGHSERAETFIPRAPLRSRYERPHALGKSVHAFLPRALQGSLSVLYSGCAGYVTSCSWMPSYRLSLSCVETCSFCGVLPLTICENATFVGERGSPLMRASPPLPMQRRVSYRDHPVRYALFVPLLVHN